jgi:putative DNA primase/helicase
VNNLEENIRAFKEAMRTEGIEFNNVIFNDSNFHRFPGIGKDRLNTAGWYIFHGDHGAFGDYSSQIEGRWASKNASSKADFKEKQALLTQKISVQTSEMAQEAWEKLSETGQSNYLKKKGLGDQVYKDIRYYREGNEAYIAISIRDLEGILWGFEKILDSSPRFSEGTKLSFKGGKKLANLHLLGKIDPARLIYIVEGFATGASVHLASSEATAVTFGIKNIEPVIEVLKKKYPYSPLIICGDLTDMKETQEYAKKHNIKAIFPKFNANLPGEGKNKDWNDLHVNEGIDVVRQQLDEQKPVEDVIMGIGQWLNLKLKKRKMILSPFMPEKSLSMIYAAPGIGKTYMALNIGLAISNGWEMFGGKWKVAEPCKVLYVDGEMGTESFQERILGLCGHNTPPYEIKYEDNFFSYNASLQENPIPDVSTLDGQFKIESLLQRLGDVKLLILDNLSCLCRVGSDNDAETWTPVQEWLIRLKSSGTSVLLIHHANKTGGQRGSSRKEDVLDSVLTLTRPSGYQDDQGARFVVEYKKSRGFVGPDAMPFEVWLKRRGARIEWEIKEFKK